MTEDWLKLFINQERLNKAIQSLKNRASIADYRRLTGQNVIVKEEI